MSSLAQAQSLLDRQELLIGQAIIEKLLERGRILPGETLVKTEITDMASRLITIAVFFFPDYERLRA